VHRERDDRHDAAALGKPRSSRTIEALTLKLSSFV
jgi:hypothetical protein